MAFPQITEEEYVGNDEKESGDGLDQVAAEASSVKPQMLLLLLPSCPPLLFNIRNEPLVLKGSFSGTNDFL